MITRYVNTGRGALEIAGRLYLAGAEVELSEDEANFSGVQEWLASGVLAEAKPSKAKKD